MIPKKLHIVWIGEEGTRPDACIDTWRQCNPEWDLKVWGNEDLQNGQWINREHMRTLLAHDLGGVMTLMRYEILLNEGGLALDAVTMARQPLDEWLRCEDFACWVDEIRQPGLVGTSFMGAEVGSPLMRKVVDAVHALPDIAGQPTDHSVGAWRLTGTWRSAALPLTIFPSHFIAPTYGDTCTYDGRGIIYGERLLPAEDMPADLQFALESAAH